MSRHPPLPAGGVIAEDDGTTIVGTATAINFVDTVSNQVVVTDMGGGVAKVEINATGGGGGGAPSTAQYVVMALNAGLSDERVLTPESGVLSLTDGGANGNATLGIATAGVTFAKFQDLTARSLFGRAANSSGVGANIAGGGAGTYMRDSGSALAFAAISEIIQSLALPGDISPTQLTADVDDYNPTSLATSLILRMDSDASRNVTGLAGGADGRILALTNIGSFNIVLKDASASSSAANRFALGADCTLLPGHSVILLYDSTSSRWRGLARFVPFTAAAASTSVTAGAGMTGTGTLASNITLAVGANADGTITVNADDIQVGTLVIGNFPANLITYAKIQQASARTVLGVTGNATANIAEIQATADQVLRCNAAGTALAFGTVAAAGLASDSVTTVKVLDANITDAKLANMGALSVKGRSANSSGVPADISATAATGAVLRESGSTIGFGTIVAAGIASDAVTTVKILDANVTYAKFQNIGARSVPGRSANSSGVGADIAGGGASTFLSDDASTLAFRVVNVIPQDFSLTGDITPSQITANQNDYNPTSLSTAVRLRLDTDANRTITGLQGGADGRLIIIDNIGSNPITLANQNTSSSAANRFNFGYDISILPGRCAILQYDSTASRWRLEAGMVEQVPQALTDGATVTPNLDSGRKCKVTLAGNRTLAAPTGAKVDGMFLELEIIQDGTGSRTLTPNTGAGAYRATEVAFPTLSTGAGKVDRSLYRYTSTDDRWDHIAFTKAA